MEEFTGYEKFTTTEKGEIEKKITILQILIKLFKFLRVWPIDDNDNNNNSRSKLINNGIAWIFFASSGLVILSFAVEIILYYEGLNKIVGVIDYGTACISALFRIMHFYFNNVKYKKMIDKLLNNFLCRPIFSREKTDSVDSYYYLAKKVMVTYSSVTFVWILYFLISPIFKWMGTFLLSGINGEDLPFPKILPGYFPMDTSKLSGGIIFYIWQGIPIFLLVVVYVSADCFWYLIIILTIGQFNILKLSIESVSDSINDEKIDGEEDFMPLEKNKMIQVDMKLRKCLKFHGFLTEYVCLMDDLLNKSVMVDYLHAIISIAFLLLDVTINLTSGVWSKFLSTALFLALSIAHMFIFDWMGHTLAQKEKEISLTIYDLPWYRFLSQKHKIILCDFKSKNPHRLTGGKTFKLSLEFFTKTMRIIFSYFTFLLQIRDEK
ncbi:Odorant receptor PhOr3 [Pediculus humanus corporis]|uniref:Odorant receptor n=1 Tax=Pediculus humanus subsp. corporis TaxID=121224 RepID=E0VTC6_PEDHC|nr:Odorant receptor PhOr3 [Pediculus humanus corporis]EEB16632.1 Odorant receptor PhOr3 [Pediculus humanus corporis]